MPNRFADDLKALTPADLAVLSHEDLLATACELLALARAQGARLSEDSRTSSRPPSSDDPYRREERRQKGEPGGSADETAPASPDNNAGEPKGPAEPTGARRPGKPLGGFATFEHFTCQPRCALKHSRTALRKIDHLGHSTWERNPPTMAYSWRV